MATYVANKRNTANITHIFWYDASVPAYSPNLMHAALPYNLLPVVPAVGDIVYFGINTAWVDSGPFCSLVFDIGTAQVDLTIDWEFSTGGWAAIVEQDNTNSFANTGINSVHWEQSTNVHQAQVVNGITAYWVRAIVTGIGAAPSPPTQQNRDVYSVVWPYVEVQANDIGGDISAIGWIRIRNQSGKLISVAPELGFQDVRVGLRSYERGSDFTAYINFSDEQNPAGITVSENAVYCSFPTVEFHSQTGSPLAVGTIAVPPLAYARMCDVDMTAGLALDYRGAYQMYLRAYQYVGNPGELQFYIIAEKGFTPHEFFRSPVYEFTNPINTVELFDLGKINIPSAVTPEGEAQPLCFALYAQRVGATTPEAIFLDLIFIPVDEWAVHAYTNTQNAYVSRAGYERFLDIDSLGDFKFIIRAMSQHSDGSLAEEYLSHAVGPVILQSNARQRLWFLFDKQRAYATDINNPEPEICNTVEVYRNQRYLTMRGTR